MDVSSSLRESFWTRRFFIKASIPDDLVGICVHQLLTNHSEGRGEIDGAWCLIPHGVQTAIS